MEFQDDLTEFDYFVLRKKKKKKVTLLGNLEDKSATAHNEDYTYIFLLSRLKSQQREDIQMNNSLTIQGLNQEKLKIPKLMVKRTGMRKMNWVNFGSVCKALQRGQEDLKKFLQLETGFLCSIAAKEHLILNGVVRVETLEVLLTKFINNFVLCRSCRKPNTRLVKDQLTRLQFLVCNECNAQSSTPSLKNLFHAITKSERRKARDTTSS